MLPVTGGRDNCRGWLLLLMRLSYVPSLLARLRWLALVRKVPAILAKHKRLYVLSSYGKCQAHIVAPQGAGAQPYIYTHAFTVCQAQRILKSRVRPSAGTVSAGLLAGCPTMVVPFFGAHVNAIV